MKKAAAELSGYGGFRWVGHSETRLQATAPDGWVGPIAEISVSGPGWAWELVGRDGSVLSCSGSQNEPSAASARRRVRNEIRELQLGSMTPGEKIASLESRVKELEDRLYSLGQLLTQ